MYVYVCIKNQDQELGFGGRKYKVGDFITFDGQPTKDIDKAYIFKKGEYDVHSDYFELRQVKITLVPKSKSKQ